MNNGYLIYQAERTMTGTEQRATDTYRGELAASLATLLHAAAAPLRFRLHPRTRAGQASHARHARAGVCVQ
jgi:hypothetical protein